MKSYFAESDTVSNLLDEKKELQKQLESLEIELTKKQYESNCIVNGSSSTSAELLPGHGCSNIKFEDLEKAVNSLESPKLGTSGVYTNAEQQQIDNNAKIVAQYELAKERKEKLPSEIAKITVSIKEYKEKIKAINELIDKKTIQKIEEEKKTKIKYIVGGIAFILIAYLVLKPKNQI